MECASDPHHMTESFQFDLGLCSTSHVYWASKISLRGDMNALHDHLKHSGRGIVVLSKIRKFPQDEICRSRMPRGPPMLLSRDNPVGRDASLAASPYCDPPPPSPPCLGMD
jgi:hypothetical protein